MPLLRWSVWRMMLGRRHLEEHWQVGDGREAALAEHVLATARAGDLDDAIRAVDEFAYGRAVLINVGDEKGAILDAAIRRAQPRRLLELGTYCGYSALRTVRAMPDDAHLYSIEFSPDNAAIAGRILEHAGVGDRVTVVVGTLGDGGATIARLEDAHGFGRGTVDFVFIDHAKDAYLPDLERILERGWLHRGSVVVADNVKFPGVPGYREHMREREGAEWRTTEHETHVEYQTLIKDLVLESEYLAA
jgi:catechol O-methyltransferase